MRRLLRLLRPEKVFAAVAGCAVAAAVIGIAPRTTLAGLLEPGPPPKPVVRMPRRLPYKKPTPFQIVELKPEAPQTDWAGKLTLLPKDKNGATDWVSAIDQKLITPKPGIDEKAEDQPVLELDVELQPKGMPPEFKATYPHRIHTTLFACDNCHTAIFQMQAGADAITMEKIFAGEYCGRCHGKVAFDPATNCVRCHRSMPQ